MGDYRSVWIESDGGSRGNPGQAAYGSVLKDAVTGEVIAEAAARIGIASNNVAEYRGLIAGLELYHEYAEGAELEVRLDSKLIVEQMTGNWKIKHPDMRPLALRANRLAPPGTTYTWVPREQNKHADRLVNEVLDAAEGGAAPSWPAPAHTSDLLGTAESEQESLFESEQGARPAEAASPAAAAPTPLPPPPSRPGGTPTTFILVRHGETDHTTERRFSGRGGSDPALNVSGLAQARATADWLSPLGDRVDRLLSSPLRRTRETADVIAARLGLAPTIEEGLAEADFGAWDGLTYREARDLDKAAFEQWFGSLDVPAGGHGDTMTAMAERVEAAQQRLLSSYPGQTVLAVSHVTPIKLLVRAALDLPLASVFRMELSPCSVTVLSWYPDGRSSMRLFNATPYELSLG